MERRGVEVPPDQLNYGPMQFNCIEGLDRS